MSLARLMARAPRLLEPESMDGPAEARVYDRLAQAHAFLDRRFARRFLDAGIRAREILDVGCGTGRLPLMIARAAPEARVTAVDLSPEMLRLAADNCRGLPRDKIRLLEADGKRLPFPNACFDAVISHHTLHHLPDPARMLWEMVRVLKRGGLLFVRDLRRPERAFSAELYLAATTWIYGRLGPDKPVGIAQYRNSLAAALSRAEWRELAAACRIPASAARTRWLINHQDILWRKTRLHDERD